MSRADQTEAIMVAQSLRPWPASWPLNREPFHLETNIPGIFAAGDVRHGSVKCVASSVGEGSMAVMFVHRYLENVALRT